MKKAIIIFLAICTAAGIIALIWRSSHDLSLSAGDYEILAADVGPVVQTIPASGIVEPENEVLLLSPAASIILKVETSVGSNVGSGEVLLRMDPSPVREQIERIQDELTIKRNNLERTQLNARSTRVDLDYNVEVKKLAIASLKSELADQVQLLEVGGISPARHEKTKQELVLAEKDLQTIYEKNSIRLQQLIAEERGLKLQIEMQEKELADKMLLLEKMAIRAPSAGIILEIRGQAGEKVNNDQMLVRMSDLSSFKIRASVDATQDDLIKTGRKVLAILDQQPLPGRIGNISPEIREKKIEFDVSLNQSSHSRLRPNLTVDLLVVKAELDSVLRLPNHAIVEKGNAFEVFVVGPGRAVSREIKPGLKGDNYVEIQRGIEAGDRILVTEAPQIRRMKEVAIQ